MSPNEAPPTEPPALCVAIHDVAPATWPECLRLYRAIRAVDDIPITWLTVPYYHGSAARSRGCDNTLTRLLADGHEVALHGYTHLDTASPSRDLRSRLLRTVYTQGEGEFAAIDFDAALRKIDLGLRWCRERNWPVDGFVAPAWLLGEPSWQVVRGYPFVYTTTWRHFHLLQEGRSLLAPALVYAARNRAGRLVSPPLARALACMLAPAPLVRLALHPRDAHYPDLIRHAQKLVERLLRTRVARTKIAFARQLATLPTSTVPSSHPATSAIDRSPQNSAESYTAEYRPWR